MDLLDRVALVTGAGRRIGRAIALRLAEAGCRVAVHYGTSERDALAVVEQCRSFGVEAVALRADLVDAAATAELVRRVERHFGQLDVLVNNASEFAPMSLDAFSVEAWDRTLRVNLTAPMALAHAASAALRRARGRIVNLCDASTARPWPDHLAYMVSKGGLDTLTRVLARALAPEVNVVGIAVGVAAWPENFDQSLRDKLTARIPLRRAGSPEDIASAVLYVLRDGDYLTGAIIPIDGGRHVV
jgi:pteridine reductase